MGNFIAALECEEFWTLMSLTAHIGCTAKSSAVFESATGKAARRDVPHEVTHIMCMNPLSCSTITQDPRMELDSSSLTLLPDASQLYYYHHKAV